jgi:hypothetical protein
MLSNKTFLVILFKNMCLACEITRSKALIVFNIHTIFLFNFLFIVQTLFGCLIEKEEMVVDEVLLKTQVLKEKHPRQSNIEYSNYSYYINPHHN